LACTVTLLAAAKAGQTSESEITLAEDLENDRNHASHDAQVLLATAQWHCGDLQASLLTLDHLDATDLPKELSASAKAINGWIAIAQSKEWQNFGDLGSDDDQELDGELIEALELFDAVLAIDPSHVEVVAF
jgi:hypothetical protein